MPYATFESVVALHGTTTIPAVRNEPEAMAAPTSLFGWTTSASEASSSKGTPSSSAATRLAPSVATRWTSTAAKRRRVSRRSLA